MTAPSDIEKGRVLFAGDCVFIAGAANFETLPASRLPEVAFAGRSNVGKSSLINALTGRKTLARVSNTPGRTRQINLFRLGGKLTLADLPGYGYAKVSKAESAAWNDLILAYLRNRPALRRVLLLIDARRGVMDVDADVMKLMDSAAVSYQLVLTKADALKPGELSEAEAAVREAAAKRAAAHPEIMVTSADAGQGIAELRAALAALATGS
jgi:GTP-binding protein